MIETARTGETALDSSQAQNRGYLLALRLFCLSLVVSLLTIHIRSVRVFRWEQSVSGGLLVTYSIAVLGLSLCSGANDGGKTLQVFLTGCGAVLFGMNAITIYRRWKTANELTRVVSELLEVLGVPLRSQVYWKALLSALVSILLFIDFAWQLLHHRI